MNDPVGTGPTLVVLLDPNPPAPVTDQEVGGTSGDGLASCPANANDGKASKPDPDGAGLQEWAALQSTELTKAYLDTLTAAGAPAHLQGPLRAELASRPTRDLAAAGVGLSSADRRARRRQWPLREVIAVTPILVHCMAVAVRPRWRLLHVSHVAIAVMSFTGTLPPKRF